jgi:hypothetical protein
MDLKLRRRAVYTGMSPYFDDAELMAALQLWQTSYSDKPKFAFTEFLSVCCNTKELKAQRNNILSSIFKAMELPENLLLADPIDETSETISKATKKVVADPTTDLFAFFFESLLNKSNEEEADAIRAFVKKRSEKLKLDPLQKKGLLDWLTHESDKLILKYDLLTLRQLINFAYIAICEYKGPVKADQLLAQTIKETKPLADEAQINLHDFL